MKNLKELDVLVNKHDYKKKYLIFKYGFIRKEHHRMIRELEKVNFLFSACVDFNNPKLRKYLPYKIFVKELIQKNDWTKGDYVAVENEDGSLNLYLNFKSLLPMYEFPTFKLVWVIFHELRHKIQMNDNIIKSVINYTNWVNFKKFIIVKFNIDEDLVNHIFHELNPCEIDAHIFACENTGIKFSGTAFDINDEKLSLIFK